MRQAHLIVAALAVALAGLTATQSATAQDKAPLFTSAPMILVRSPDPDKLVQFYIALGFKAFSAAPNGGTIFHLEGDVGSFEVVQMDKNTQPSGPKTSRTQQGVVAIFETTDQAGVVARAKAAGAKLIEKWVSANGILAIYYIADPENNIFGFAPRHSSPVLKTP